MPENSKEIFISYAWGGESEDLVNQLDEAFQAKGITIIRDKRNLPFKGSIKAFMERIGRGTAIIIVISDKYLKSENCMFELIQIAENGQFYDRIFPVVLSDANIYKAIQRIKYVQYWEQQIQELDEGMKTVGSANLQGFREDIDLYTKIRETIPQLTHILKDMNTLTPSIHIESDFKALFEAVDCKLTETEINAGKQQDNRQQLLDEIGTVKFTQDNLDQGINQLVSDLQDTLDPQLKKALAWLSDYKERADNIGKLALKQHTEVQEALIRDIQKSRRFYKELENCLYRLHFALFTDNFSPLDSIKISFKAEVYKTALDILEKQIPMNDKKIIYKYIEYFKNRLDIVDM